MYVNKLKANLVFVFIFKLSSLLGNNSCDVLKIGIRSIFREKSELFVCTLGRRSKSCAAVCTFSLSQHPTKNTDQYPCDVFPAQRERSVLKCTLNPSP
jgi:hypothetical protein